MPSHGSTIECPACGAPHMVVVGEIDAHRQINFLCLGCGWGVSMEHDGSGAKAVPKKAPKAFTINPKKLG